jgi:hypothetical protein
MAPMWTLVIKVAPGTAARAAAREASADMPCIERVLRRHRVDAPDSLQPDAGNPYLFVRLEQRQITDDLLADLRSCTGVAGAYAKPPDMLPGP